MLESSFIIPLEYFLNIQRSSQQCSTGKSLLHDPFKIIIKILRSFFSTQQINIERLEAQIKEKLHDLINRRQSQPSSKSDTETTDRKLTKDDRKLSKTDLDNIGKKINASVKNNIV